ncbi:unnamed protein product [Amoebophrya sp. A120]|nr:unnamed protein product [Amoebophrya sp. A120]|eukprot:GSA120T00017154001.1
MSLLLPRRSLSPVSKAGFHQLQQAGDEGHTSSRTTSTPPPVSSLSHENMEEVQKEKSKSVDQEQISAMILQQLQQGRRPHDSESINPTMKSDNPATAQLPAASLLPEDSPGNASTVATVVLNGSDDVETSQVEIAPDEETVIVDHQDELDLFQNFEENVLLTRNGGGNGKQELLNGRPQLVADAGVVPPRGPIVTPDKNVERRKVTEGLKDQELQSKNAQCNRTEAGGGAFLSNTTSRSPSCVSLADHGCSACEDDEENSIDLVTEECCEDDDTRNYDRVPATSVNYDPASGTISGLQGGAGVLSQKRDVENEMIVSKKIMTKENATTTNTLLHSNPSTPSIEAPSPIVDEDEEQEQFFLVARTDSDEQERQDRKRRELLSSLAQTGEALHGKVENDPSAVLLQLQQQLEKRDARIARLEAQFSILASSTEASHNLLNSCDQLVHGATALSSASASDVGAVDQTHLLGHTAAAAASTGAGELQGQQDKPNSSIKMMTNDTSGLPLLKKSYQAILTSSSSPIGSNYADNYSCGSDVVFSPDLQSALDKVHIHARTSFPYWQAEGGQRNQYASRSINFRDSSAHGETAGAEDALSTSSGPSPPLSSSHGEEVAGQGLLLSDCDHEEEVHKKQQALLQELHNNNLQSQPVVRFVSPIQSTAAPQFFSIGTPAAKPSLRPTSLVMNYNRCSRSSCGATGGLTTLVDDHPPEEKVKATTSVPRITMAATMGHLNATLVTSNYYLSTSPGSKMVGAKNKVVGVPEEVFSPEIVARGLRRGEEEEDLASGLIAWSPERLVCRAGAVKNAGSSSGLLHEQQGQQQPKKGILKKKAMVSATEDTTTARGCTSASAVDKIEKKPSFYVLPEAVAAGGTSEEIKSISATSKYMTEDLQGGTTTCMAMGGHEHERKNGGPQGKAEGAVASTRTDGGQNEISAPISSKTSKNKSKKPSAPAPHPRRQSPRLTTSLHTHMTASSANKLKEHLFHQHATSTSATRTTRPSAAKSTRGGAPPATSKGELHLQWELNNVARSVKRTTSASGSVRLRGRSPRSPSPTVHAGGPGRQTSAVRQSSKTLQQRSASPAAVERLHSRQTASSRLKTRAGGAGSPVSAGTTAREHRNPFNSTAETSNKSVSMELTATELNASIATIRGGAAPDNDDSGRHEPALLASTAKETSRKSSLRSNSSILAGGSTVFHHPPGRGGSPFGGKSYSGKNRAGGGPRQPSPMRHQRGHLGGQQRCVSAARLFQHHNHVARPAPTCSTSSRSNSIGGGAIFLTTTGNRGAAVPVAVASPGVVMPSSSSTIVSQPRTVLTTKAAQEAIVARLHSAQRKTERARDRSPVPSTEQQHGVSESKADHARNAVVTVRTSQQPPTEVVQGTSVVGFGSQTLCEFLPPFRTAVSSARSSVVSTTSGAVPVVIPGREVAAKQQLYKNSGAAGAAETEQRLCSGRCPLPAALMPDKNSTCSTSVAPARSEKHTLLQQESEYHNQILNLVPPSDTQELISSLLKANKGKQTLLSESNSNVELHNEGTGDGPLPDAGSNAEEKIKNINGAATATSFSARTVERRISAAGNVNVQLSQQVVPLVQQLQQEKNTTTAIGRIRSSSTSPGAVIRVTTPTNRTLLNSSMTSCASFFTAQQSSCGVKMSNNTTFLTSAMTPTTTTKVVPFPASSGDEGQKVINYDAAVPCFTMTAPKLSLPLSTGVPKLDFVPKFSFAPSNQLRKQYSSQVGNSGGVATSAGGPVDDQHNEDQSHDGFPRNPSKASDGTSGTTSANISQHKKNYEQPQACTPDAPAPGIFVLNGGKNYGVASHQTSCSFMIRRGDENVAQHSQHVVANCPRPLLRNANGNRVGPHVPRVAGCREWD